MTSKKNRRPDEQHPARSIFSGQISPDDVARLANSRVMIAGLGNIGSFVVPLVARMRIGHVRLIDRGRIESKNFSNQSWGNPADVGRPKAEVIAEQLRAVHPELEIEPIVADLEDVPLGKFTDVDLCLGGLDSLQARQFVGEQVYRLGIPYVDGGVDAGGDWYGRVQVFPPGRACLECAWSDHHYRHAARETPCDPTGEVSGPPTLAPALLGTAVTVIMVSEGVKILLGHGPEEGLEISFDLTCRRWLISKLSRNTRCRFDHQIAREQLSLPGPFSESTIGDLLDFLYNRFGTESLQLEFRRRTIGGAFFTTDRYQTAKSLEPKTLRRLSEFGLSADDMVQVRHNGASIFVGLESVSNDVPNGGTSDLSFASGLPPNGT